MDGNMNRSISQVELTGLADLHHHGNISEILDYNFANRHYRCNIGKMFYD